MSKRRKSDSVTVVCPIVYGSMAFWQGRKADEHATHKWTLYVRGPNDEDLSTFIEKVMFSLHPSFAVPTREITAPPFEVSEFGWGEFEAGIRLFFKDPSEKPIDILHNIRLYPANQALHNPKKPVVSEVYDEIVFTSPSDTFRRQLMMYSTPKNRVITPLAEHYTIFDEASDLSLLNSIHEHVISDLELAKTRLLQLESELSYYSASQSSNKASQSSSSGGSHGSVKVKSEGGEEKDEAPTSSRQ